MLLYNVYMKRRIAALVVIVLIAGLSGYYGLRQEKPASASTNSNNHSAQIIDAPKSSHPTQPEPNTFNKNLHSLDEPSSIWVIANKKRPLQPKQYVPNDLVVPNVRLRSNITSDERQIRTIVANALQAMVSAAESEKIYLTLESGYRSYQFQSNLYNRYVGLQGQATADTQSARPGHSEHQTGLAADVGGISQPACNIETCFAKTIEGKWVAANAHKYGFIIRYPSEKTPITGYIYEPWHVRYVGVELATEVYKNGSITMEEFFGLPAAPDYN